jgi:hypothetical protein
VCGRQSDRKSLLKIAQNVTKPIFVKIDTKLLPWKKLAQQAHATLYFSKHYPTL